MIKITADNYEYYKKMYSIIWDFQSGGSSAMNPYSPIEILKEWESKSMSLARKGLKEGLRDSISMIMSCTKEEKENLNIELKKQNFQDLNLIYASIKNTPIMVLKRGYLKSQDEFYIIKDVVTDTTAFITDEQRKELNELLTKFEEENRW